MQLEKKYSLLKTILKEMGQVVVAYSGGVDSTFLLKVAYEVLGKNCYGVLALSPSYPSREYHRAMNTANQIGARIEVIRTKELDNPLFVKNSVDRCYFCKSELFDKISKISTSGRYPNMVDGTNFDDMNDHRPGKKAMKERNVRSPLLEAELTKSEIRELSKELGLSTWEKDELACLSSRFAYGETITQEKLDMVDKVENFLSDLGFRNIRARQQANIIRIEVQPDQIPRILDPDLRREIVSVIKSFGYTHVTLDLEGYRRGSMNEGVVAAKPASA